MLNTLVEKGITRFIRWARDRSTVQNVYSFEGVYQFTRYAFFLPDEWQDSRWDRAIHSKRPDALPWWCPFNAFVHCWNPKGMPQEMFHDHPRWSITLCLRGRITEITPWSRRELRRGSIVVRSHKAIHAFEVPAGQKVPTWTLFIVGRRKHQQNTYGVTPR